MARRVGSDGARTEAAIREAALRLIARVGYEALSMRRLAEEVGLGAAALYRYFPTKQAILFDAVRPPRTTAAPRRQEAYTRLHLRYHLPRAHGVFLSYMELRSLSPENFAAIEALRRQYERDLAEILADGAAAGQLAAEEPRVTARAIIAMLTGITTWYRAKGPLGPRDVEDIYWNMVARMTGLEIKEAVTCS